MLMKHYSRENWDKLDEYQTEWQRLIWKVKLKKERLRRVKNLDGKYRKHLRMKKA